MIAMRTLEESVTTGDYWSIVKANVADGGDEQEAALNEWWNDHLGEYVDKDGFFSGWRMRAVSHEGEIGTAPHRYHAVYEVDNVASFNRALEEGTASHPGRPWGPWQEYVDEYLTDWERTYYHVLARHLADDHQGRFWACVKADVAFDSAVQDGAFNDWYTNTHMPEICSYDGVYRGWRLEVSPDANDLGPRRHRYWGVYEVESPAHFAAARRDRLSRGIEPWDGIWLPYIRDFKISFYEVLHRDEQQPASATAN
jgi:hypothetical protein